MKKEVIGICPVCQNNLTVTKLTCLHCHTEISGEFALSRFSYLSKDELSFIETFIKVSGNIKEMEKELNISYPTVKKYLDGVIVKMGFEVKSVEIIEERDVLDRLKNKEITVQEATELLKR